MGAHELSSSEVRVVFPPGTVLHNPVTGEYARIVEHAAERAVGELLAVPGAAVAGPHIHPAQEERFEVVDGVMGYRLGDHRGELRIGEAVTVPPGMVHDWWNAGDGNLRARVTVTPPGLFAGMIGAAWGLAVVGRTNAKGMPKLADAALLAETFANEIIFERPPHAVQRALAVTIAPIARRRGRSVTGDMMRAASSRLRAGPTGTIQAPSPPVSDRWTLLLLREKRQPAGSARLPQSESGWRMRTG